MWDLEVWCLDPAAADGVNRIAQAPKSHPRRSFSHVISCLFPLPLFLSLGTTEGRLAPSCLPTLAPPGICTQGWEPLKPSPDGPTPALPASPCSDSSHWWRAMCFLAAALPAPAPLTASKTWSRSDNLFSQWMEEFSLCYETTDFMEAPGLLLAEPLTSQGINEKESSWHGLCIDVLQVHLGLCPGPTSCSKLRQRACLFL